MLQVGDVIKCISKYKNMDIGRYGVVIAIDDDLVEIELASSVGDTGSLTTTMRVRDIVKVGRLF